jgi:GGDEF domain-containing protein
VLSFGPALVMLYDFVGRWEGGDEFLAMLTDASGAGKDDELTDDQLKRRIRDRLSGQAPVLGLSRVSASIGIARYPKDGRTAEVLIRVAEDRMRKDKGGQRAGRDS